MIEVLHTASTDSEARRLLSDPYTLSTDRAAEPELGRQPDLPLRRGRDIAPELAGIWTAGFMMAPYNTRIVRRSNALLDWAYGRRFRYSEHMSLGSSFVAPVASVMVSGAGNAMFGLGARYFRLLPRRLVQWLAPKPGTGPAKLLVSAATIRPRPTPPRPPVPVMWRASRSRAIRVTKRPPCCWGRAAWHWPWTVTSSPTCVVCSPGDRNGRRAAGPVPGRRRVVADQTAVIAPWNPGTAVSRAGLV
ncbi:putative trans-acting enoyl reductase family protein [Mycobacterium xenopi 4042]|uniref:Putative trans-acting enoyl reductase family protein n=1 Tax=Mycobacterium xenopi 4042 TaxID=1299334 RepID=X8AQ85_MYCXE|nr:putative trans-acting enoyl reductase family protein [Mycobacterium xenopi 4042]